MDRSLVSMQSTRKSGRSGRRADRRGRAKSSSSAKAKDRPVKGRAKIEEIRLEISNIRDENTRLDWQIPSELERLTENRIKIMNLTGSLDELLRTYPDSTAASMTTAEKDNPFTAFARAAVTKIFGAPPKTSGTDEGKFQPVSRRHLTLVHSRGGKSK